MVFTLWASRCCQTLLGTAKGAGGASAAEMGTRVAYYLVSDDHVEETGFTPSFSGVQ